MPGFKASKDRPIFLLGAGALKLKPVLTYHSPNPKALKNYAKPTLSGLYKWFCCLAVLHLSPFSQDSLFPGTY